LKTLTFVVCLLLIQYFYIMFCFLSYSSFSLSTYPLNFFVYKTAFKPRSHLQALSGKKPHSLFRFWASICHQLILLFTPLIRILHAQIYIRDFLLSRVRALAVFSFKSTFFVLLCVCSVFVCLFVCSLACSFVCMLKQQKQQSSSRLPHARESDEKPRSAPWLAAAAAAYNFCCIWRRVFELLFPFIFSIIYNHLSPTRNIELYHWN